MSTIVAAYHYYRPLSGFSSRDYFIYLYLSFQRLSIRIVASSHDYLFGTISINNLRYHEKSASENDGQDSSANAQEASMLDDTVGSGFSGGGKDEKPPKKGLAGKIQNNRKKLMAASAAGAATLAIVGAIISAPGFLLTHISTMFMDKVGDLQSSQSATFRRSKFSKFTDRFSIEGRRGGAIINEMEKYGYRIEFDGIEKTKIGKMTRAGVEIDPADFDKEISGFLDNRYKLFGTSTRSARWKTKRMDAFYGRFKVSRSSIVKKTPNSLEDPKAEMNSRYFNAIDGQDSVSTDINAARAEPNPDDYPDEASYDAAKAEYDSINGSDNPDSPLADAKKELREGADVNTSDNPIIKNAGGLEDGDPASLKAIDDIASANESFASQGFGAIKGIGVVTDVGDKMCSANNSLEAAIKTARLLSSVKLMRATLAFVSADDGQRRGEASSDLVKELMKRVTLSDAVLGNFASSQGYNATMNKRIDRNLNAETRSQFSVDGKLTGFWGGLKGVLSTPDKEVAGINGCAVLQNVGFQVAQFAGVVALSVFSFGTAGGAAAGASTGLRVAVQTTVKSLLTRRVALGIATGVAIDLGFDQIIRLTQMYVQKKLDIPFTGQEVGGRSSAMLFAGAGVLHKQRNLKSGFIPATKGQFALAQAEYLETIAMERSNKSFTQRMFDMDDTDSLAYKGFVEVAFKATNPAETVRSTSENIASMPSLFAKTLTSPITKLSERAYAQAPEESFDVVEINGDEFAADPYGNLHTFMPDWLLEYSDPVIAQENLDFLVLNGHIDSVSLEPVSDELVKHIEYCVDSTDTISVLEEYKNTDDVRFDCLANLDLTKRFKGYLINIDADDFLDAELFPEEIGSDATPTSTTGNASTTLNAPGLNGYAVPCQGDPRTVVRQGPSNGPYAVWDGIPTSGTIGTNSAGQPINVYIREACDTTNVKTIFIASSIHATENGGQFVSHELLFNTELPRNVRIIAVPEINKAGLSGLSARPRVNANGVNLNRNFDYNWSSIKQSNPPQDNYNYKGASPASEPETKALVDFVNSLGYIDLALHYHDGTVPPYVAAAGNTTPLSFASIYGSITPDTRLRAAEGGRVFQSGSFDGWQNQTKDTPSLLIEMSSDQSTGIIQGHVSAVKAVISSIN
jgi:hypothetical protein